MPLPGSGTIKLSELIAEFGGGTKLSDFYRGGGLVPDTATNSGVPVSGTIKLSDFYGAAAISWVVNFDVPTIAGSTTPPGSAGAGVTFYGNDGITPGNWLAQASTPSGPGQVSDTWITDAPADLSDFDVMFELLSGVTPSGTLNTWMSLATSRSVTVTSNFGQGTRSATIRASIRYNGGATLHQDSFILSATA